MKKNLVAILLSTYLPLFPSTNAAKWVGAPTISNELKNLIESLDSKYLSQEEEKSLHKEIKEFDYLMKGLSHQDNFFLTKSNIYKWILQNPPKEKIPIDFTLKKFLEISPPKDLLPFPKWIFLSLKSDALKITQDPLYENFLQQSHQKKIPRRFFSLQKKIEIIRPWSSLFYQKRKQGKDLNLKMIKIERDLLTMLISQYKIFYQAKNKALPLNDKKEKMNFFTFVEEKKKSPSSPSQEVLSDLDKIIAKHRKAGLPPPTGEWNLSQNDIWSPGDAEGKIILPTKNYVPPKTLPTPVDDWNF